tara:strand:- start:639 stop:854 length:216 start_codon:yes stop_codon:yes gene_type:complete
MRFCVLLSAFFGPLLGGGGVLFEKTLLLPLSALLLCLDLLYNRPKEDYWALLGGGGVSLVYSTIMWLLLLL